MLAPDDPRRRETFEDRLERLRREVAPGALLPAPPAGAKPPPRAWCDVDDEDEGEGGR
jgi:hypothetical protein